MSKKRVLLISPHTDDIEIGASAITQHYIRNGYELRHIAFSLCRESIPEGFPQDITEREFIDAQKTLSIEDHHLYDFPVREFSRHRQDILDVLIEEKRRFRPDIVLSTSPDDIHQDHSQMGKEVKRAFFNSTIIYYSPLKMYPSFMANMYLNYSTETWEIKKEAIGCYGSQLRKNKDMLSIIEMNDRMLGSIFGMEFVEPFRIEKMFMEG